MKISQSPGQIETFKHLVKSLLSCNSAEEGLGGVGKREKKAFPKGADTSIGRGREECSCLCVSVFLRAPDQDRVPVRLCTMGTG